jgi:hypothetical protein
MRSNLSLNIYQVVQLKLHQRTHLKLHPLVTSWTSMVGSEMNLGLRFRGGYQKEIVVNMHALPGANSLYGIPSVLPS